MKLKDIYEMVTGDYIEGTLCHYENNGTIGTGKAGSRIVFVKQSNVAGNKAGTRRTTALSISGIEFEIPSHYSASKLDNGKSIFYFNQ